MNQIINQFRRIFSDNGTGDKDFTGQEARLREAQRHLAEATDSLSKAAGVLSDVIQSRA